MSLVGKSTEKHVAEVTISVYHHADILLATTSAKMEINGMPTPLIVYANIAWMTNYRGPKGDKAEGGFGFLKQNGGIAHESWNFQPWRGKVFGYVPRSAEIKIARLGATRGATKLDGVTVVWIARNPRTKRTVIVGWYLNATIHKKKEHIVLTRSDETSVGYQIEAKAGDAVLLPIDARMEPIPTAKTQGNLGQSPVWYGKSEDFNLLVLDYISRGGASKHIPSKSPRQSDPELRRKVEQAAVNHAIAYYESEAGGTCTVESVEKDGVGWDLEATRPDNEVLKVEVKGLSGKSLVVELTPNEYKQMKSAEHRKNYIVYVLLDALGRQPRPEIFRYDAELTKERNLVWANDSGQRLSILELVAARLSVS